MADQISDVSVSLCSSSKYVTPFRLNYKQDGVEKTWDYIKGHDSIAILLYNKDRDVFPVVKQFRPAVYAAKIKAFTDGQKVDTDKHKGEEGMTLELCAGLMDKDKDVTEMAQAEVLEETGYKVPLENLKKITSFRNGVGVKGTLQTLFYAEITDQMKVGSGGGLLDEGEQIEVIELSNQEALKCIMDETITKPVGMMFAFTWFFFMKDKEETLVLRK
ncbi:uridine diphosphate glucose pyrophosphatase NUDT14 isoform X1 [Strongylocentrotus purpuratus]|uniref:Uridine diphosphate glucose pyrophosphatase NUDT14 n=1 Tax=Strongylocentrotus purpuratus TaxID=7668 RepID=A0A7M7HDQ2_STRPU|nr:uridine diphosphate glucose pyrophosphatase NUDT14 isoform X1 [Strongylocentrotus purpuratus]|eukprot:XP_011666370.1 PREDICTED: uridine diphosphate glucose pyrophosphatase isoform X2 [Strongylocentrotus purpuratus]